MRLFTSFAAAALLASPLAILADTPPVNGSAPAKPAKPKKICREMESRTGSHMGGGRVCRTLEQWRLLDTAEADTSTMTNGAPTRSSAPSGN